MIVFRLIVRCAGNEGLSLFLILTGTSPCNGDSGGGMVFNRNGAWYLRGIVSLSVAKEGYNFCDPNHYAIFTDLSKFSDFIQLYLND